MTTFDADGNPQGATSAAVASISVEPLLLLVSLGEGSVTRAAVAETKAFLVHFMAVEDRPLAERFAKRIDDKFEGVDWTVGLGGLPMLGGPGEILSCAVENVIKAGDHTVFIGGVREILRVDHDRPPLVYYRRGFHRPQELIE